MCLRSLQLPTYADPILDRLDPQHLVSYRLYRDSTQYVNGKHMRDLSKLNRDLGKVLLITADPESSKLQPENAVQVCHARSHTAPLSCKAFSLAYACIFPWSYKLNISHSFHSS